MRTIVHVSDLHFPRVDRRMMAALAQTINHLAPDLVVVSGDLTQRARRAQFLQAAAFLRTLQPQTLVVPGNHDVPMFNIPARLIAPFAGYQKYIREDLEPVYRDAELLVVGLNSVRTVLFSDEGRLNVGQADRGAAKLRLAAPGVIKIIVTHHPFDVPEGGPEDKMIGRSRMAMERLASVGTDIFLAGHLHVSHVGGTATRYKIAGHSALLVQAGTMSTRERGEPNSFNVIRIANSERVTIDRMAWNESTGAFDVRWQGAFRQTAGEWSAESDGSTMKTHEVP
jgi:3',5'-cyclic AMP phosphodiesterase CpdA